MTKLCIDLCSGSGDFSQAFVDAGYEVVRIDNNPQFNEVPHTIIADVLTYDFTELAKREPLVVIASPPCERFSLANSSWPRPGIGKALQVVGGCLEAIIALKPKYWALENPKARLRWFLGAPPHSIRLSDYGHKTPINRNRRPYKLTDVWGNIPFKMLLQTNVIEIARYGVPFGNKEGRAKRARMPYGLSQAILEAVDPEIKLASRPSQSPRDGFNQPSGGSPPASPESSSK
ncbi:MAG: DNA cytosine methyltransferase [Nitrososphaerota archaeon]|nr:DNA cytosine methyltransferase [Nitrososphaerota archaeon]